jgi:hypothetical protein
VEDLYNIKIYEPLIGDVVKDNVIPVVVVALVNYESIGSCYYDRRYLVCDENT